MEISEDNMKLEPKASHSKNILYLIIIDGTVFGSVVKTSKMHTGYESTETYYEVFMGEILDKRVLKTAWQNFSYQKPKVFSPVLIPTGEFEVCRGNRFPIKKFENGSWPKKRMITWIKTQINNMKENDN